MRRRASLQPNAVRAAASGRARIASLFAGLTIGAGLMLFPFLLRDVAAGRLHAALPVALLGVAGALVHGIGYRPDNRWLRVLFGPACAWLMMAADGALLLG